MRYLQLLLPPDELVERLDSDTVNRRYEPRQGELRAMLVDWLRASVPSPIAIDNSINLLNHFYATRTEVHPVIDKISKTIARPLGAELQARALFALVDEMDAYVRGGGQPTFEESSGPSRRWRFDAVDGVGFGNAEEASRVFRQVVEEILELATWYREAAFYSGIIRVVNRARPRPVKNAKGNPNAI